MTVVYISTFPSVVARNYFVGRPYTVPFDPYHDAFKTFVGPFLYQPIQQGLIVIDFVVQGDQVTVKENGKTSEKPVILPGYQFD